MREFGIRTDGLGQQTIAACRAMARKYQLPARGLEWEDVFQMSWIACDAVERGQSKGRDWALVDMIRRVLGRPDKLKTEPKAPVSLQAAGDDERAWDVTDDSWSLEREENEEREDTIARLSRATLGLPERARKVFAMRFVDGARLIDCARAVCRTEGAVCIMLKKHTPYVRIRLAREIEMSADLGLSGTYAPRPKAL